MVPDPMQGGRRDNFCLAIVLKEPRFRDVKINEDCLERALCLRLFSGTYQGHTFPMFYTDIFSRAQLSNCRPDSAGFPMKLRRPW